MNRYAMMASAIVITPSIKNILLVVSSVHNRDVNSMLTISKVHIHLYLPILPEHMQETWRSLAYTMESDVKIILLQKLRQQW